MSQLVCAQQLLLKQRRIIIHNPSFMKTTFQKTTLQVIIFLCIHFVSEREKETLSSLQSTSARPCVLRFHVVNHFILGGICPWVSKHHSDCVRDKICFKEIVSNTRLNMIHSSFIHLVYEFLIICKFLLLYIQYIFITFVYHIYLCYYLFLDLCIIPFTLS